MNIRFHRQLGLVIAGGLLGGFVMTWLFGMYTGSAMLLQFLVLPMC